MQLDSFEQACDRLSHQVDAVQFERMRWSRCEGPMLAQLVALAHGVIEQREDLELTEEGSTRNSKGFVLKVHGQRIVRIDVGVSAGSALVSAAGIARSAFNVEAGAPVSAEFAAVDKAWMAAALEEMFGRLRAA